MMHSLPERSEMHVGGYTATLEVSPSERRVNLRRVSQQEDKGL